MKKLTSLFSLLVLLGTSFLTPVSYAQTTEMGIPNTPVDGEFQNEKSNDILKMYNTDGENTDDSVQSTAENSDDSQILQIENRELNIASQVLPQRSGTMFIPGEEFNLKLKNLANDAEYYDTWDYDENIIKFEKSKTPVPAGVTTTGLATDDSEYEIIAWYDNGTIYYHTEADEIYLNPDSGNMFEEMEGLSDVDTSSWDTSKVINMGGMFYNCITLRNLDLGGWNTSNVTNMQYMFCGCSSLISLDLSSWNTSKVENMESMFWGCSSLISLDLSKLNMGKVTDTSQMFHNCKNIESLDVSNWDTSNIRDMSSMFEGCFNLKSLDVSNWDTSNVKYMGGMFYNCITLENLSVENWDTSNVVDMGYMFDFCINLRELNLRNWDASNVGSMNYMFYQCDSLETIYVSDKFVTTGLYNGNNIFLNDYSLIGGNGTKFNTDYVDKDYANIDTDQNPGYFTNISGNTVIIRFFMNNGSDIDIQVVEKGNTIESVEPSKDNAIFKGWYSDERLTRSFNPSTAINSNLKLYAKWECKPGYYNNKGQCTDENKNIEHKGGVIKITDGENTVYIKDRNQGATQAKGQGFAYKFLVPILERIKGLDEVFYQNIPFGWLYKYIVKNLSEISGKNMSTIGEFRDYYDKNWINVFKAIKSKNDGEMYTDSYGDYYYWGNNNRVSYKDLTFKEMDGYVEVGYYGNELIQGILGGLNEYLDSLFVDIPESKIEGGFNGGKIGIEGEGWIQGNSNPCDANKGEYLPTVADWVKLMQVWGNINGHEVVKTELGEGSGEIYVFGSGLYNFVNRIDNSLNLMELLNLEITDDLMIPGAGGIVKIDSDLVRFIVRMQGSLPEEEIDNAIDAVIDQYGTEYIRIPLLSPLWVASESGDTVGIYIGEAGIMSITNDIGAFANDIAAPVRCFVDESAWPTNEEQNNNHYSGGGGKGGSNSKSDTEANTHGAADEQKDTDNDKKTEEKQNSTQNDTQNEDKSETTVPQNNQGSKGSNSNSDEFQQAYNFAHSYGITTKDSAEKAQMNSPLTRIQMAKMLSQYAMNVLGKEPDISKGVITFKDVTNKMNKDYNNGVTLAYQLGIMGQNMKDNKFRPNDEVSRAEFVTALSRLLYSTSDGEYKSTGKYYINHMEKLKKEGIITNDNPTMKEKRGYVMVMLMRSIK